jgi:aminoglycoside phosphotransferase (APT) family kinase protein
VESVIELDPNDLERAFGHPVSSYEIEAIDPHLRIHSVTGGVYRVRSGDESLVIKIVRHGVDAASDGLWLAGADVSHRNYWKREWLAFDSGLLDELPGDLRAPRCLHTAEHADGDCWIWMEDVRGRTGAALTLDDYAKAAHDLGTTQGALASAALQRPDDDWLSRRWLRGWVAACEPLIAALRAEAISLDERLSSLRPLRARVLALWERREELLAIVEAAPQTLVHCDFWPTNLYVAEDGSTVAIDWSQIGSGAIGQDLDQVTLDTVWMQVRPDESLELLDDLIVPAYLEGLHAGGYRANAAELRGWYAAAAAAHYPWMAGMQVVRAAQPEFVAGQEERFGRPFIEIVMDRARVIERAVSLGEGVLAG